MVKFIVQGEKAPVVGIGITEENVIRLKQGQPIHIVGREIGINHDIVILYGKDLENLTKILKPFIGDETSIIDTSQRDPEDEAADNMQHNDPEDNIG